MQHIPATLYEPASVDFDSTDEREIDSRIAARGLEIADATLEHTVDVASFVWHVGESDDTGAMDLLSYILESVIILRQPVACFTAEERIERFVHEVRRRMLPYAEEMAEQYRKEIEADFIRDGRAI